MFRPLTKFERAAEYARNAIHGRSPVVPTEWSLWAGRLYHNSIYRNFYLLAMLGLCLLAWWEPVFKKLAPKQPDDPVPIFRDEPEDDMEEISAKLSAAGLAALRAVDGCVLALAAFDLWLQERYHGLRGSRRGWLLVKLVVILALAGNWATVLALPKAPYWTRLLRPILLLERMRNVRKVAGNIARSVPAILNVGALLVLTHLFFAVLGVVLFAGIDSGTDSCTRMPGAPMPNPLGCTAFWEDDDNPTNPFACKAFFTSLDEASIQLFALLVGASNFPNFMLPVYACNPANALYFMAYAATTTYLLATILLAVAAKAFNDNMLAELLLKHSRTLGCLDIAYATLTGASDIVMVAEEAVKQGSGRGLISRGGAAAAAAAGAAPLLPLTPLKLEDLVGFFAVFSPGVAPGALKKLVQVLQPSAVEASLETPATLTRDTFRTLMLVFGRIRTNTTLASSGQRAAEIDAAAAGAAEGAGAGTLAAFLRCCGRDALGALAPLSQAAADIEDAEWLDGDALAAGAAGAGAGAAPLALPSPFAGESKSVQWAQKGESGAEVVANPLATASAASSPVAAAAAVVDAAEATVTVHEAGLSPIRIPAPSPSPSPPQPASPDVLRAGVSAWGEARPKAASPSPSPSLISSWLSFLGGASPTLTPPTTTPTTPTSLTTDPAGACVAAWQSSKHSCLSLPSLNPALDPSAGRLRAAAARFLSSPLASLLFDGAIAIFCIGELWQLSVVNTSPGAATAPIANILILELCMLSIFLLELLLKVAVYGPVTYLRAKLLHKLDLGILLAALVLGSLAAAGGAGGVDRATALSVLFLRALRLGRYLGAIPGFTATVASIGDLLPLLARYLAIVLAVMYAFAIVGMNLFAGRLDEDEWVGVQNSSYGNGAMEGKLTFDSLPQALVVLFYQMLVNDWPVIMEGLVHSYQSLWPRAYFVIYLIVQCAVVVNVVLGFLIEAYGMEKAKRDAIEREALQLVTGGGVVEAKHWGGVVDWRALIRASGVSFEGYTLARTRHYTDVFDSIFKQDILEHFPGAFGSAAQQQ